MRSVLMASGFVALMVGCDAGPDPSPQMRLSLLELLSGADTVGYERAFEPRSFEFPADHGPHPAFRTEWWYVTGNLTSRSGRDFGFQFTIFRSALAPHVPETSSDWGTNQAYMGHFTVTDIAGDRFLAHERFARGAAGLAGAETDPLRVWLEDWTLEATSQSTFPLRLRARAEGVEVRLDLERGKPVVLQGEDGLSRKGPEPGNASYYYSLTRLPTSGTISIGPDTLAVTGDAWLDREWSTSALSDGHVGWDWFALQLDDGWDLMLYRLRRADGGAQATSAGVLVAPDGESVPVSWEAGAAVVATGSWASPVDGTPYPSGWRISVPERGWDLSVEPRILGQELDGAFRYWEGTVAASGRGEGGEPVTGRGYVELTGYAGGGLGR